MYIGVWSVGYWGGEMLKSGAVVRGAWGAGGGGKGLDGEKTGLGVSLGPCLGFSFWNIVWYKIVYFKGTKFNSRKKIMVANYELIAAITKVRL